MEAEVAWDSRDSQVSVQSRLPILRDDGFQFRGTPRLAQVIVCCNPRRIPDQGLKVL